MVIDTKEHRGPARVCPDCWHLVRPDEYEPDWTAEGTCSRCGEEGIVHRVSWAELDKEAADVSR